ncbi:MAG: serine protease, partial [Bacteroidota bacterium]
MSYDRYQKTLARMYSAISDDDDNIIYNLVGTGFLIAEQYLLTCAHVIASALGIDGKTYEIPQGVVFLDFPFLDFESDSKKNKKFRARVAYWLPEDPHCNQVEDIAGLYLLEPLSYKLEPARMKSIEDFHSLEILKRHHLRIFGFPEVPGKEAYAVPASAPLANRWIQIQDTYETGPSLKEGFSGSPVWDEQLQGIVGMVLAKDTEPNRKIAYMIPRRDLPAFENVSLYQLLQKLSEFEHEIY